MLNENSIDFQDGNPLQDPATIDLFETERGIRLPDSFRKVAIEHDGAYLEPAGCRVDDPITGRRETYACSLLLDFAGGEFQRTNSGSVEGLPRDVIAFGVEGGGFKFCFDYRDDRQTDNPPIVIFIPEYPDELCLIRVAPDFDAFLAALVSTSP